MRKIKAILLLVLSSSLLATWSPAQIISTAVGNGYDAGTGSGSYSGDGGPATNAELYFPEGIVFNKSGNMYISEGEKVEMINMSTGIINNFTSASLLSTGFIGIDDSGNIYIPDGEYNIVYKGNVSTGIITAVAGLGGSINKGYYGDGGPATAALLDNPVAVAIDDTGNIYISDGGNNVIRKVTIATGIITTVVGNGYGHWHGAGTYTGAYRGDGGLATAAELYGPQELIFDDSANIYFADLSNNVVRKVTAYTGIISTVAGNGVAGFTGDSGDGGPATNAVLWYPDGVALDKSGNIYIADANNVVRKVTVSTGIISTVAGNGYTGGGTGGYSGDGGQATDAELDQPAGIRFDTLGNMYIADALNNVIRKVTPDTNTVTGNKLIAKSEGLRVFPNPSNGVFTLSLSNSKQNCSIEIFNYLGESIYKSKVSSNNTEINLSGQSQGIYLYRVLKKDGSLVGEGKVVIGK